MAVSADVGNKLIGWMLVGAGTLLTYAAVRNRSPWDVLRDIQGSAISTPAGFANPDTDTTPSTFSASIPRIRMIANREIPPVLVMIRPNGQLDKDAAASLERVHTAVGKVVRNVGSFRSYAEQAAAYYGPNNPVLADGSRRYARPGTSLHEVGLALDVHADDINMAKAAMFAEGWKQPRPGSDANHFSYLVSG